MTAERPFSYKSSILCILEGFLGYGMSKSACFTDIRQYKHTGALRVIASPILIIGLFSRIPGTWISPTVSAISQ